MEDLFRRHEVMPIVLEEEMKRSYLDYAMSVIASRALPDVRDGLKPVHRRILFSMNEAGYDYNKPHRKSARIVGDVMGKYHPHGDQAIYDAMVRMAQDFSMRLPLIDGQGNFGSMDGDPPAAQRYTEARLAKAGHMLLETIDKETVDFEPNYDDSLMQPVVLPARYPNLLVNGAGGIAVGMATNIPSHNLGEVIDACCAYIMNPDISLEEITSLMPGPDFPTGGLLMGTNGIRDYYRTGRGSLIIRARTEIEDIGKDKQAIIIKEIPYQVNKARMIERIAEVVKEKLIEGISDLRDESDRDGVRVVIEIKKDVFPEVILNQLYRYTPVQTSFGVNMLALRGRRPETMGVKDILKAFAEFREETIIRRTRYDLKKAREKAHTLIGLWVAVLNLDAIIRLIKEAKDPKSAKEQLIQTPWQANDVFPFLKRIGEALEQLKDSAYFLSEEQAKAILDLRLHRLTGLERDKIVQDLMDIIEEIEKYLEILCSREKLLSILIQELQEIKEAFASPRRTTIEGTSTTADIEDLIQPEDMVVTVSHAGYIKRVSLSAYRSQKRGGKGRSGMSTREDDFVETVFVANTHTPVLFFSNYGRVYEMKVYRLPLSNPQARGKAIINLLPLKEGEKISTIMPLPDDPLTWENYHIVFVTSKGSIRRNNLKDFVNLKANGKIAMKLEEDERLITVSVCQEDQDIFLATKLGRSIRFQVSDVRVFSSRTSTGVRGLKLLGKDSIVSMTILKAVPFSIEERDAYLRYASRLRRGEEETDEQIEERQEISLSPERIQELAEKEEFILTIMEKGFGKRTSAYEYRITNRAGIGIANADLTEKTGVVVTSFPVKNNDHIMIVTDNGTLIRCPVEDIRIASRKTQGVMLFRVAEDEKVVSAAHLAEEDEVESEEGNEPSVKQGSLL